MSVVSSYFGLTCRLRRLLLLELFVFAALLLVCFIVDIAAGLQLGMDDTWFAQALTSGVQLMISGGAAVIWLLLWYKLTMMAGKTRSTLNENVEE